MLVFGPPPINSVPNQQIAKASTYAEPLKVTQCIDALHQRPFHDSDGKRRSNPVAYESKEDDVEMVGQVEVDTKSEKRYRYGEEKTLQKQCKARPTGEIEAAVEVALVPAVSSRSSRISSSAASQFVSASTNVSFDDYTTLYDHFSPFNR